MQFQPDHLRFLRECRTPFDAANEVAGGIPVSWFAYVSSSDDDGLPAHRCKRADLFRLVKAEPRIAIVSAAILAWGGMQRHHGKRLFERTQWLEIAEHIRQGRYSRGEAYDAFAKVRADGDLPGMGPAYFTKLIYFLTPRTNYVRVGYIMDQWTACSINVLLDKPDAILTDASFSWLGNNRLGSQYVVSDHNSSDQYEGFCQAIETLATEIDLTPDEAELLLLSEGGRNPFPWREYVKKHRRPALNSLAA